MEFIIIDEDGSMDIIKMSKNESIIKYLNNESLKILYYWRYNNSIINVLGIDDTNQLQNSHKLPTSGISEILNEESDVFKLHGKVYIYKTNTTNNMQSINIPEYAELFSYYNNDLYSSTDEEYEEEVDCNIDMKGIIQFGEGTELNYSDELDFDRNIY